MTVSVDFECDKKDFGGPIARVVDSYRNESAFQLDVGCITNQCEHLVSTLPVTLMLLPDIGVRERLYDSHTYR